MKAALDSLMPGSAEKSKRPFASSLIGQRMIEAGYLTDEQLREALVAQAETGLLLGEVCILKEWLTYQQVKECLPELRTRLGERLMAHGYITMEQLWLALLEQRHSGWRLGEILVSRGWVDKVTLDKFVALRT